MDKEKFKKGLHVALIIFAGLALAITYFFFLNGNNSIGAWIGKIVTILRPFIVGAVIAYILKSTCNAFDKKLMGLFAKRKKHDAKKDAHTANIIAVILTYITWIAALTALLWVAIPQVIGSISTFISDIPSYYTAAMDWIVEFKQNYPAAAPYVDQAGDYINNWLTVTLPEQLPEIGGTIVGGAVEVFNVVKDVVIGLVISVFFLSGRKVFAKKTTLLVNSLFKEKHANAIFAEARFADRMFSGFLEGKIIDSTIIGIIYFIALVLMDIRYAALLALICGITNIIPFFGPFLGAVPSGLIILMSNEDPLTKVLYFIIFVCVIQFVDGYIIDPHIVGGNIKISPFCVIFAVLFFGGLWGFTGLLIGVPTFAVIYDIIRKLIYNRLKKTGKRHILKAHLDEFGNRKKKQVPVSETPLTEKNTAETPAPETPASEETK